MKFLAAFAATCLVAGPAVAQIDTSTPAQPAPEAAPADKPAAPTLQAQRGAAPVAEAPADKPVAPATDQASPAAADKPQID